MTDPATTSPISRPPTPRELAADRIFRALTLGFSWLTIIVVVFLIAQTAIVPYPAMEKHGTAFITGDKWDGKEKFGILPEIVGTLYSAILGVMIGGFFGVA